MQGSSPNESRLGANRLPDGNWEFLLWAPNAREPKVHLLCGSKAFLDMEPLERGYHRTVVGNLDPNSRYLYRLDDGRELPDPASRFQPEGVHAPSQLVNTKAFRWTDQDWAGRPLEGSIFYELHVGTYTPEGTFAALIPNLAYLADLGITTVEVMPIAQFPGSRNWGYDGVYEFAPQHSYGGPAALQQFINEAHHHGLAVALDVVYNHLGPEGNYLSAFAPYFTDRYRTPWGEAVNFDGAGSDEVRRFFIENALYWLEDYHFDALRLDAIHGIFDFSAKHFLAELKEAVANLSKQLGRTIHLLAESDLNDACVLHAPAQGGYGIDAQWSDDFHHSVHTLLTNEKMGYYADFGGIEPLVATLKDGWFYSGQYSQHRQRRFGNSPLGIVPSRFVVCNQNHDQVGNRAQGERLNTLIDFEGAKLAAGITLLSPFTPLLFMGEEYGESAPFQYFVNHRDPALVEAVRKGRREESAAFGWQQDVPDPQDEKIFRHAKLDRSLKDKEPHSTMLRFYRELIRIRREHKLAAPASQIVSKIGDQTVLVQRERSNGQFAMIFNFSDHGTNSAAPQLAGDWSTLISSADSKWKGTEPDAASQLTIPASGQLHVPPHSFLLLSRTVSRGK
jgi:maltooligosyltrehalose trehalohydrolase